MIAKTSMIVIASMIVITMIVIAIIARIPPPHVPSYERSYIKS
jgi:hypothetical protein